MPLPLVRIQHHPKRAHLLHDLTIGCGALDVEVVTDPDPYAEPSALRTYRRCVAPARPGVTHLVVMQDDVELCRDFDVGVLRAIRNHPDQLIALFVAGAPKRSALEVLKASWAGEPFVEMSHLDWVPTVALVWPVADALNFSRYVLRVPETAWADDPIVGGWCRRFKKVPVATVPSLVQHPDVEPSLIDKRADHAKRKQTPRKDASRVAAVFYDRWSPVDSGWPTVHDST